jgi:hypothetical protein
VAPAPAPSKPPPPQVPGMNEFGCMGGFAGEDCDVWRAPPRAAPAVWCHNPYL